MCSIVCERALYCLCSVAWMRVQLVARSFVYACVCLFGFAMSSVCLFVCVCVCACVYLRVCVNV